MRKRTIKYAADTIFWTILYLLPVISYLIYLYSFGQNPGYTTESGQVVATVLAFESLMSYSGLFGSNFVLSPIYGTLYNLFSLGQSSSVFPILSTTVLKILSYFISVYILHLAVDFLLFIPRLAHKWLKQFTNTED